MNNLQVKSSPELESVFNKYPILVRSKLFHLRKLILSTANEIEEIEELEETLKWGEPSFLVRRGSTIRIDWKAEKPNQYGIYFKCTSKLVPTFKVIYNSQFKYEGNRAIIFQMNDEIPEAELKKCISAALTYHKVKDLPMLGMR